MNDTQLLARVRDFMNYHNPEVQRTLPESARGEYLTLHSLINAHFNKPKPAPVAKPVPKKAAKKKASKKK